MKFINYKKRYAGIAIVLLLTILFSCKKYLEEKSDSRLVIPSSIADAQALLDQYNRMNGFYPTSGSLSDDDLYLADTYFNSIAINFQNQYTWGKDVFLDNEWNNMYSIILHANVSLETINGIRPASEMLPDWQRVKGTALFFRSYAFYHIAQNFAVPYEKSIAASVPGIPLRMQSDVSAPNKRDGLEATYRQIIKDLTEASLLLPVATLSPARPGRPAAYAALARVYLAMHDYSMAGKYADSCLQISRTLINYNTLDPNATAPFTRFNPEVIFSSTVSGAAALNLTNFRADTFLYNSYHVNDLRKRLFFRTNGTGAAVSYSFKGSYDGTTAGSLFNGPAVNEMYLTRAECFARSGNTTLAINDLNTLLVTRWRTGTFIPFTALTADDALIKILSERRKELVARGLRWFDLRRLNQDTRFSKTLIRKVNGVTYMLPPNDPKYTFYIPSGVVALSGMEQNKR